jgi:hypothetical protein
MEEYRYEHCLFSFGIKLAIEKIKHQPLYINSFLERLYPNTKFLWKGFAYQQTYG